MERMKRVYGLSVGKINLKNGNTTHFNVIENDGSQTGTLCLFKKVSPKDSYIVVSGAGSTTNYSSFLNKFCDFEAQARRVPSNDSTCIKIVPATLEGMAEIIKETGKNSASFCVFK
jgi:hypothetical protein